MAKAAEAEAVDALILAEENTEAAIRENSANALGVSSHPTNAKWFETEKREIFTMPFRKRQSGLPLFSGE